MIPSLKALFTGQGKFSTKSIISFFVGLGGLMQIQQFRDPVLKFADSHPHIASTIAVVTGIAALLHNPQVQDILHITTTKTETVSITPEQK
jgi:hypothetical protein